MERAFWEAAGQAINRQLPVYDFVQKKYKNQTGLIGRSSPFAGFFVGLAAQTISNK
jgi:hypothetical protein